MDTILEVVDTFIADYIYAHLFPIKCPNDAGINISAQAIPAWQPVTTFLNVQPSQAAYMSSLTRDNPYRQFFTLFFSTWLLGIVVYFFFATLFYYLLFDKRTMNHPKFLKNQIWLEIKMSNQALPIVAIFVTPLIMLEIHGHAKLYDTTADGPGLWYDVLQIPLFLLFTEFCSYWIHRLSHHPRAYKHVLYAHKLHHRFILPTPYSSQATHPMEGVTQSLPYHIFAFILPIHKTIHAGLFFLLILWIIGAHDGKFLAKNRFINGAACHSMHHTHRDCNFGQIFTLFDRLHGTYRKPKAWMLQEDRWKSEVQMNKDLQMEHANRKYLLSIRNRKYD